MNRICKVQNHEESSTHYCTAPNCKAITRFVCIKCLAKELHKDH
jgi:hypothetical protein